MHNQSIGISAINEFVGIGRIDTTPTPENVFKLTETNRKTLKLTENRINLILTENDRNNLIILKR